MNWLDTQTKELLQKVHDEKLSPSKTAEFALVLLRKGPDYQRLVQAIVEINKAITDGKIKQEEIDVRCKKILQANEFL